MYSTQSPLAMMLIGAGGSGIGSGFGDVPNDGLCAVGFGVSEMLRAGVGLISAAGFSRGFTSLIGIARFPKTTNFPSGETREIVLVLPS